MREQSVKLRPRGTANGRERADAKIRCTRFLPGVELSLGSERNTINDILNKEKPAMQELDTFCRL